MITVPRIAPILLLGALAAAGCQAGPTPAQRVAESDADMVVFKSPYCGCCDLWVDHARESGYTVDTVDIVEYDAMTRVKEDYGIPIELGACHTTIVGGYVVEGHVPAEVIGRLLAERPDIHGLAVPGMPIGSPGMEGPNAQPYQVIAIGHDGARSVFEIVDPRPAASAPQR